MTLQLITRRIAVSGAVLLAFALYLGNLTSMGLVSTDEPRYAAIGRAMAESGDWVTPRLWGRPWFEKPPLLYWMIAAGHKARLPAELAPRLPVALMGLFFLGFFWLRLRKIWDPRTAWYSAALLATSAGWLALSHVAVTDLPMAVLFSAAVLLSMDLERPRHTLIASLLGLATLAKSLPPLIFFLPVLLLDYRRWRSWLKPGPVLAFAGITLPWHILCARRNGREFLDVLFVQHQFGRFLSPQLQHVQKWWFYLPVLALLLYPWFPLAVLIPRDLRDPRVRVPGAVILFGLLFLSLSTNKLATYLLPFLPLLCALIGSGAARAPNRYLIAISIGLLGILPIAAGILPEALATGLRSVPIPWLSLPLWLAAGLAVGMVTIVLFRNNSLYAAAALAGICFLWFQSAVFPQIDRVVSARPLWLSQQPDCAPPLPRRILYGLNYYAGRDLTPCDILDPLASPVVR